LPVLVKGILHPDDARRVFGLGLDGIVVPNHGGRQVDSAVAALDALVAVRQAVGSEPGRDIRFSSERTLGCARGRTDWSCSALRDHELREVSLVRSR